jgi:hypothetical protein
MARAGVPPHGGRRQKSTRPGCLVETGGFMAPDVAKAIRRQTQQRRSSLSKGRRRQGETVCITWPVRWLATPGSAILAAPAHGHCQVGGIRDIAGRPRITAGSSCCHTLISPKFSTDCSLQSLPLQNPRGPRQFRTTRHGRVRETVLPAGLRRPFHLEHAALQ